MSKTNVIKLFLIENFNQNNHYVCHYVTFVLPNLQHGLFITNFPSTHTLILTFSKIR